MGIKFIFRFLIVTSVIALVYLVGPQPDHPRLTQKLPEVPGNPAELEQFIQMQESAHQLKPGNQAQIVWRHPGEKQKTRYSIVYLHGFTASHYEGFPVHQQLAEMLGCNLFLARLSDHGVDTTSALAYYTADRLWESAKMAYQVGLQIGEEVILISTSTGGTIALNLAARYPHIAALVNYSPNIRINDQFAFMLNNPWGLQFARLFYGGDENINQGLINHPVHSRYWSGRYRLEALVQLQELLETTMRPSTFARVQQPVFNAYYFKNEQEQDPVVKVSAIRWMHQQLGTPEGKKQQMAFPKAGQHVLGCTTVSKDVSGVLAATANFLQQQLNLQPTKLKKPEPQNEQDLPIYFLEREPEISLAVKHPE